MFSSTRIQSDECNRAPARVGVAGDYSPRAHRNPSLEKPCTTVSVVTYHQGSEADFLRLLFGLTNFSRQCALSSAGG